MVLKIPSAGGQVPRQIEAPASASALAIAKPKPPSSATPATNARFPLRSMASMRGCLPQPPALSDLGPRDVDGRRVPAAVPAAPLGLDPEDPGADGSAGAGGDAAGAAGEQAVAGHPIPLH